MDEEVEEALRGLRLTNVTLVPLRDVETTELNAAKSVRTVGEYCWTVTPFLQRFVIEHAPEIVQVTYLDADLYFFDSPRPLLEEFQESGKDVLITEHAFAPEYSNSIRFGRFCVQFMTFRNTDGGRKVLRWWQDRCLEWCYAREEGGKFGDQKYLDEWPEMFRDEVHVLRQTEKTLAPWNVAHTSRMYGAVAPVFFHFHSLKVYKPNKVRLFSTYYIGAENMWIYERYLKAFRAAVDHMRCTGIAIRTSALPREPLYWIRRPKWWLQGRLRYTWV